MIIAAHLLGAFWRSITTRIVARRERLRERDALERAAEVHGAAERRAQRLRPRLGEDGLRVEVGQVEDERRRVLDRRPLPEPLAAPATITLLSLGTASLGVLTLVLVWIE